MKSESNDIPLAIIDAFVEGKQRGNPAAVCCLSAFPADSELLAMAAEHNLSETAFVVPLEEPGHYRLRWFTPKVEVPLCGHATLATAHYLFTEGVLGDSMEELIFETLSGELRVRREDGWLWMDFPAWPLQAVEVLPAWVEHFAGLQSAHINEAQYLLLETANPEAVAAYQPDGAFLESISAFGIILTARGGQEGIDFVSRFFAPRAGILEDPVTGSAHCSLFPFWASRWGKNLLRANQLSDRGGVVLGRMAGDRVHLGGRCRTYALGRILVDERDS